MHNTPDGGGAIRGAAGVALAPVDAKAVLKISKLTIGLAVVAQRTPTGLDRFPVLVTHGTEDPMVPVDRARESRERLTKLGADLTYREYEGMQHELRPEALRDIVEWIHGKVLHPIQLV